MDVVIYKYAKNRKLYDQTNSKYVTNTILLELVKSGKKLVVIEKPTGKVVTGPVLARAILDSNEAQFYAKESVEVLEEIIRAGSFEEFSKKIL
jgi:polyhydroxyalkanoate synthesis regulator protein